MKGYRITVNVAEAPELTPAQMRELGRRLDTVIYAALAPPRPVYGE